MIIIIMFFNITKLRTEKSYSITCENPNGEKGAGGFESSMLGAKRTSETVPEFYQFSNYMHNSSTQA